MLIVANQSSLSRACIESILKHPQVPVPCERARVDRENIAPEMRAEARSTSQREHIRALQERGETKIKDRSDEDVACLCLGSWRSSLGGATALRTISVPYHSISMRNNTTIIQQ